MTRGAAPGNRRALIGGSVALGLVMVAVAVHLVVGSGSGSSSAPPPIPAVTLPTSAPGVVTTTSTTQPSGQVPPSAEVYTSKDPFAPLVSTAAPGAGGSSGTTSAAGPGGSTTPSSGSTTSTTVSPSGSAGASGAGSGSGGSTAPTRGQPVELEDVYASGSQTLASIEVDDALYQVSTGQTFAGNYSVLDLSLSTQCGDFSHGGVPFHVCKGQQVLK